MGMQYDLTFQDARIDPSSYGAMIGWTDEEVAAEPEKAGRLAAEDVALVVDGYDSVEQDEEGIHLDGVGYHDSSSYGFIDEVIRILGYCVPGSKLLERDVEDSDGTSRWRVVQEDGSIATFESWTVYPGYDWPADFDTLLANLRAAVNRRGYERNTGPYVRSAAEALLAAIDKSKED